METEQLDPEAALAAIADQRREAAERLVTPWWYHPALGLLVGTMVATQAAPTAVRLAVLAGFFVGLAALVRAYQRLTGLWVSGYRRGPAGRRTLALAGVYLACVLVAIVAGGWWAIGAGAVVLVATVVLGRAFDEALRGELRG
jgi:hypothetical protein